VQWSLDRVERLIEGLPRDRSLPHINTHPADATAAIVQPFVLFNPAFRFNFSPAVDVQAGGQPGLPGGGINQLVAAASQWNRAGSSFAFRAGSLSGPARCFNSQVGQSGVTVSFNDPCQEIADEGGTLAVGGAYYDRSRGVFVNGIFFYEAVEGFVVNNDGPVASSYLQNPHCFSDIQLHELGHVLGLDHSSVAGSIMSPTLSSACAAGARTLAADDIQGLLRVYPSGRGLTAPNSAPANLSIVVNGRSSITVSFDPVSTDVRVESSAATSYRLDLATTSTGPVAYSAVVTATTVTVPIPAGLSGTFYLAVAGVNTAGAGPPSARVAFTIPVCRPPSAPTALIGNFVAGTASASWNASPDAAGYVVQAGRTAGASDFGQVNIGSVTSVSLSGLSSGLRAFVRVFAFNACGGSPPTADVLIQ
jgi:hypothetical protein